MFDLDSSSDSEEVVEEELFCPQSGHDTAAPNDEVEMELDDDDYLAAAEGSSSVQVPMPSVASSSTQKVQPQTHAEVGALPTHSNGTQLILSTRSASGYQGVYSNSQGPGFVSRLSRSAQDHHFATALEAAEWYVLNKPKHSSASESREEKAPRPSETKPRDARRDDSPSGRKRPLPGSDGQHRRSTAEATALQPPEVPRRGQKLVGRRVRVWWEEDEQWFAGTIRMYDMANETHIVLYDDGDQRSYDLKSPDLTWQLEGEDKQERKETEHTRKREETRKKDMKSGPPEQSELLLSSNSSTGYLGVRQHGGRFVAQVQDQGEFKYLGSFGTPVEAAQTVSLFKRQKQAEEVLSPPQPQQQGGALVASSLPDAPTAPLTTEEAAVIVAERMDEVRGELRRLGLQQYAGALEDAGFDDLAYLRVLSREGRRQAAKLAGVVDPVHLGKFERLGQVSD